MAPRNDVVELEVSNQYDSAIQVTSHFHFFEVNKALEFDREAAFGRRFDVPPGSRCALRRVGRHPVRLRHYGGKQVVRGFQAWSTARSPILAWSGSLSVGRFGFIR